MAVYKRSVGQSTLSGLPGLAWYADTGWGAHSCGAVSDHCVFGAGLLVSLVMLETTGTNGRNNFSTEETSAKETGAL